MLEPLRKELSPTFYLLTIRQLGLCLYLSQALILIFVLFCLVFLFFCRYFNASVLTFFCVSCPQYFLLAWLSIPLFLHFLLQLIPDLPVCLSFATFPGIVFSSFCLCSSEFLSLHFTLFSPVFCLVFVSVLLSSVCTECSSSPSTIFCLVSICLLQPFYSVLFRLCFGSVLVGCS